MGDPPIETFKEQPVSGEISEHDEFAECHELNEEGHGRHCAYGPRIPTGRQKRVHDQEAERYQQDTEGQIGSEEREPLPQGERVQRERSSNACEPMFRKKPCLSSYTDQSGHQPNQKRRQEKRLPLTFVL